MPDQASRARVQRLLAGQFRRDYVIDLLLFLRQHADGRPLLQEIGHFISHPTVRDRGFTHNAAQEWALFAEFVLARSISGEPLNFSRLPNIAPKFYRLVARGLPPESLMRETGMRPSQAKAKLERFASALVENDDGTWRIGRPLSQQDFNLIGFASGLVLADASFTAEKLIDEVFAGLLSNSLISRDELRENRDTLGEIFQLIVISSMHNTAIALPVGELALIRAHPNSDVGAISVDLSIHLDRQNYPKILVAKSLFLSSLEPQRFCDADLMADSSWNFAIDVTSDLKLCRL
ncbi:hypothetical protein RUR49_06795 [Pseudoxanthobacter sp. M-2]|uniref:hypothetical protein n=1 Tax=Pseudoxanthobacter sp. M-2 TaxID=3078754 RepID=UPI0038FC4917